MQDDVLYPISKAEALMAAFENCTLPNDEWTHEAHLIVALSLLARYGDTAFDEMKKRLLKYNLTVGRVGSFHATMTWFWLEIVKKTMQNEEKQVILNQITLDDLLFDENLADRNIWEKYYTYEEMMTDEARKNVIPKKI